jgi:hypothetical protein
MAEQRDDDPGDLERRRREAPGRVLEFFRALDLAAIGPVLQEAHERRRLLDIRDSVYRIFHSSWKMYYLREDAVELARMMFTPLGWKPTGADDVASLVDAMRQWRLDEIFVDNFERTTATVWSQERNATDAWREDARQLVAGFVVVREVALSTLEAMDRMRRGDGFLFHPREALDPTDALFLEVWTCVGSGLRYWLFENEGLEEQCRDIMRQRSGE